MFDELLKRFSVAKRHELIGSGIVASTLANIHRAKGAKPFAPADFIPGESSQPRQQTAEEQIAIFKLISETVN